MERCETSLYHALHTRAGRGEGMERRALVRMAGEVAEGVCFLHSLSPVVVHRDLKSHNVLIDFNGQCKLCDFGLVNTKEVSPSLPPPTPSLSTQGGDPLPSPSANPCQHLHVNTKEVRPSFPPTCTLSHTLLNCNPDSQLRALPLSLTKVGPNASLALALALTPIDQLRKHVRISV